MKSPKLTPAELYFGRNLNLDLLRSSPSSNRYYENPDDYVRDLREKLDKINQGVRDRIKIKSNRVKGRYDRKTRDCFFEQEQKIWLYNLRRKKEKLLNCREIWKIYMR